MDLKNQKMRIITIICAVLVSILSIVAIILNQKEEKELKVENNSDIMQFKEEYESLNGNVREGYDNVIIDLDINENLEIYYKTDEEILDVLNDEKAIIYFGFEDCPWCRAMLETFADVLVDNNQKIYYVDVSEIRNSYSVEDKMLVESKKGTNAYYEMLDIIGDDLPDYIVKQDEKDYDTKMKRIYAPTIVTIADGETIEVFSPGEEYVGDPYEKIDIEQEKKLYEKFDQMIDDLKSSVCSVDDGAC